MNLADNRCDAYVKRSGGWLFGWLVVAFCVWFCPGCYTVKPVAGNAGLESAADVAMRIGPGDELEINFFGAPELSMVQRVRPDGKISVRLFGDVQAAGKTPLEIQKELKDLYETQLQIKAVTVVARTSAAAYVTGAVIRPGRVELVRPMTAMDAVMEAGGFDHKAGARISKVRIIRTQGESVENYVVDFEEILQGTGGKPFYLKPFDTIYVPGAW
jgi:polysaccharide export outer membrane protein